MRSDNLLKIINLLKIKKELIEQHTKGIYSGPYKSHNYKLKFPITIDPFHVRLMAHVIGDGSLEKHYCRWYQKSDMGGKNIIKLIKVLSKRETTKSKKDSYSIPTILLDIVCKSLDLKRDEVKTAELIKKVLKLPREYRLQFLAGFIVDEGSIQKSAIKITNTDKTLLKELRNFIISLGYPCSEIKQYRDNIGEKRLIKNNLARVNYNIQDIFLYADSMLKLKKDLESMTSKYGSLVGLWHKQKILEEQSSKVDLNKLKKRRESKDIFIPLIKKRIKKNPLSVKEFSKEHNLEHSRIYKVFHRLKDRKEIKRISVGIFAHNNYN